MINRSTTTVVKHIKELPLVFISFKNIVFQGLHDSPNYRKSQFEYFELNDNSVMAHL